MSMVTNVETRPASLSIKLLMSKLVTTYKNSDGSQIKITTTSTTSNLTNEIEKGTLISITTSEGVEDEYRKSNA